MHENSQFSKHSTSTPQEVPDEDSEPASALSVVLAAFGLNLLFATCFPIGARGLVAVTGGMKSYSPAAQVLLPYVANYVPLTILLWLILHRFKVMDRIPRSYRGTGLFGFGAALILVFFFAGILASAVPGGGPLFALAMVFPLVLLSASAMLITAAVRLCIGYRKGVA